MGCICKGGGRGIVIIQKLWNKSLCPSMICLKHRRISLEMVCYVNYAKEYVCLSIRDLGAPNQEKLVREKRIFNFGR